MPSDLRELTRQFGRGETTLEALRMAARAENRDRGLADQLLQLIREWEISPLRASERAKNDLREAAENLVPPPPPPLAPSSSARRDPSESIYAAGLRGQKRRD